MASYTPSQTISFFVIIYFATLFITTTSGQAHDETIPVIGKEKVTHLHFYFHDIVSGSKPSAMMVAKPVNISGPESGFGATMMADDALTEGPEPTSKVIGRAQGMYAMAAQEEPGLLMVMNYAFTEGEFNGSSLAVLGRNQVFHPVREMPIVGGTGAFRLARGYALAKTIWYNTLGDAIVEYNVTVLHY